MERDVTGVGFAERGKHVDTAARGDRGRLTNEAALANSCRSGDTDDTPLPVDCLRQCTCQRPQFPLAPHQTRLPTADESPANRYAQEATRGNRRVGAFDVHQLWIAQNGGVFDQSGGGLVEHHSAGRCHRFHALSHTDLFTDRGITQSARTDLAGDHLTGVESHSQL